MVSSSSSMKPDFDRCLASDGNAVIPSSIPDVMSVSFIEHVLKGLPSNIFLKDNQCRYVFTTQYWDHFQNRGSDWSIKGKTDLEVRRNAENAQKAYEQDLTILATGKGTSYVVKEDIDGKSEYFEVVKSPVFGEDGSVIGIVGLVSNVTEKELMRLQLEKLAVTDPMTGLLNRHHFSQLLESELEPDQYPAAIIMADCDRLKVINDTYGHACGNDFICETANLLKKTLPENALVFRTGGDEFVAIVPKVNQEQAHSLAQRLSDEQRGMKVKGHKVSVSIGLAPIRNAKERLREIVQKADFLMYEKKAESHAITALKKHVPFGTE